MASRTRTWTLIAGVIVLVLIGAVVAAPFLVPVDVVRDRVVAAVHQATGRDLTIKGGVKLSVFPTLGVSAKDVSLSNAPWAGPQPLASLSGMDLRVKVLPLLKGQVAVDKVVLDNPVINLATDAKGQANWRFTPESPAKPQAQQQQQQQSQPGSRGTPEITLADVRLVNGRVVYANGATGKSQTIDGINVKVSLPNFEGPLAATGEARWQGRTVGLSLNAGQMRSLLEAAGSPVHLALSGDLLHLDFEGKAALAEPAKADGTLDMTVPSLRTLATTAGVDPAGLPPNGLNALAAKGHLALDGNRFTADNLQLSVDDIKATGRVAAETGGARPSINGQLDVAKLDLNPYLPPPDTAKADKGKAQQGWSDKPIDASALRGLDAQLALSAGAIVVRKIDIGRTTLRIALANGKLVTDLAEMALYGGRAQGRVTVDASGSTLATQANLNLDHLQAGPLIQATAGSNMLTGTAAGQVDLASRGGSERQLVSALSGKGKLSFTDGAIQGIDLVAMVNNVASAFSGNGKTDFTELGGSFTAANGVVKNSDLSLKAPLIRLTGAGTVTLPDKSVDYRLVPQVAATLQGQSGGNKAAGLSVPVLVRGPWSSPSYTPDLAGMASKQLGGQAGKMLDALTGGQAGGQQQAQTPPGGNNKGGQQKGGSPLPIPLPIPGLGR